MNPEVATLLQAAKELEEKSDWDGALRIYHEIIEHDSNHAHAWNNLGNAWAKKGNYDQAILCYDRAMELDPNIVSPWYNLGNTWFQKGDNYQAIVYYNRAIELVLFFKLSELKSG